MISIKLIATRSIAIAAIVCYSGIVIGQSTQLVIFSPDSILMSITVNEKLVSDSSHYKIQFDIGNETEVNLKIDLFKDSLHSFESTVAITTNHINEYNLLHVGTKYILALSQVIPLTENNKKAIRNDAFSLAETKITESDSNVPESFIFMNTQGCSNPCSSQEFDTFIGEISECVFEKKRKERILDFIEKHCLFNQQISDLSEMLSYEESRIEVLSLAYSHTYDSNGFKNLESLISLEKNKILFRRIYQN